MTTSGHRFKSHQVINALGTNAITQGEYKRHREMCWERILTNTMWNGEKRSHFQEKALCAGERVRPGSQHSRRGLPRSPVPHLGLHSLSAQRALWPHPVPRLISQVPRFTRHALLLNSACPEKSAFLLVTIRLLLPQLWDVSFLWLTDPHSPRGF